MFYSNNSFLKRKLKSKKGASITFALLIFLVCAVVCSVVLTAATTASGRMAKIAEMDQKYYSVMSAADLIREMIEKDSVTVERITKEKAFYIYDSKKIELKKDITKSSVPIEDATYFFVGKTPSGWIESEYDESNIIHTKTDNIGSFSDINKSFLTYTALRLVNTSKVDASNESVFPETTVKDIPLGKIEKDFSIVVKDYASQEMDFLSVGIKETTFADGSLVFEISNKIKENDKNKEHYLVVLTFGLDKKETTDNMIDEDVRDDITDQIVEGGEVKKYSFSTTEISKTVTNLRWSLNSFETYVE